MGLIWRVFFTASLRREASEGKRRCCGFLRNPKRREHFLGIPGLGQVPPSGLCPSLALLQPHVIEGPPCPWPGSPSLSRELSGQSPALSDLDQNYYYYYYYSVTAAARQSGSLPWVRRTPPDLRLSWDSHNTPGPLWCYQARSIAKVTEAQGCKINCPGLTGISSKAKTCLRPSHSQTWIPNHHTPSCLESHLGDGRRDELLRGGKERESRTFFPCTVIHFCHLQILQTCFSVVFLLLFVEGRSTSISLCGSISGSRGST